MLSREDNELLTRTNADTPMGKVFRSYWLPALVSTELEPDGNPIELVILGEELVAFRDTNGKVGVMNKYCPHRGASLVLGRNEGCGLACIYHGWKFDVNGDCVDVPSEENHLKLEPKVHIKSYITHEAAGIVWIYMGAEADIPPKPDFEWMRLPQEQIMLERVWQENNYLQGVEGGLDTVHQFFLHRAFERGGTLGWGFPYGRDVNNKLVMEENVKPRNAIPKNEVEFTNYGLRLIATQDIDDETDEIRVFQFMMPSYTFVGDQVTPGGDILFHCWVPRDDYNVWVWDIHFNLKQPIEEPEEKERRGLHLGPTRKANILQQRDAMKTTNYSGVRGIGGQDHIVQESMERIFDRTKEYLVPTDKGITGMRRLLLKAVRDIEEGKKLLGLGNIPYHKIQRAQVKVPKGTPCSKAVPLDPDFALQTPAINVE